jgi:hypothetical protein
MSLHRHITLIGANTMARNVFRLRDTIAVLTVGGVQRPVRIEFAEHKRNKDPVEVIGYQFQDDLPWIKLDPDLVESEAVNASEHYLTWGKA